MKAFYSILYATLNPAIREQIGVGLILTGENNVIFDYSRTKLSHINAFLPKSASRLLKDNLKNIQHTIDRTIDKNQQNEMDISINGLKERVFTQQYIDYLSRYNKNLLSFSSPVQIDLEPSDENFRTLFDKYIFKESSEKRVVKESINTVIQTRLYPKIKGKVNLDADLNIQDLDTLAMPVHVNFIGKNGQPVVGKAIDFQSRNYDLLANFYDLISLIKAFDEKNTKGKYFVIGDEPDKKSDVHHNLWKHISELKYMDLIPSSEMDQIAEFIEKENVQPFLP
ncbi:MAG: hypothetical protein KGY70_18420 [Bacteroidales bacterium]|nr:hypothetical protein [Bacteroidales bacterium]